MSPRRPALLPALLCAALLAAHAALAWLGVRDLCATFDEPTHLTAAVAHLQADDFHVDPDNPPLFKLYAALPQPRGVLDLARDPNDDLGMFEEPAATNPWTRAVLYQDPRVDADAVLNRSRAAMLMLSLALGAALALTAWKLAGPVAAVLATTLYALDPNFLAHGPLVKNDVPFALAFFLFAIAVWQLGRHVTVPRLLATAAAAAAACLTTKFTGLLAVAILPALLLVRVLIPAPWPLFRDRPAATRRARAAVAALFGLLLLLTTWAGTWAPYGFRFAPTRDPHALFTYDHLLTRAAYAHFRRDHPDRVPTEPDVAPYRARPDLPTRAVLFADAHRLLPQPWLFGFLIVHASMTVRHAYLLGHNSLTGWWYYFPCAMAFKTPLATIAALAIAIVLLARRAVRHAAENRLKRIAQSASAGIEHPSPQPDLWTPLAFAIPAAAYLATAMTSHLNVGLRHVLPLYPFIYLFTATTLARALPRSAIRNPRSAIPFIAPPSALLPAFLILLLATETLPAFPHFIPFFNLPSRLYGPLKLLSDSNLDWGQDLKRLAAWQRDHPDTPLLLCYFGSVPPEYYGIRATPLPGSLPVPGDSFPQRRAAIAISATCLQGTYLHPKLAAAYATLLKRKPLAVLGTIYVYDYP